MTQIRGVLLALGFTAATLGSLHAQVLATGGFLANDAFRILVTGVPAGGAWKLQTSQTFSNWTDLPGASLQPGDNVVVDPAPVSLRYYRAITETPVRLYSSNAVGFIKLDVPAGFKMIANQLVRGDNRIGTLMVPPESTALYKFSPVTGGYRCASYVDGAWEGDDPEMTLAPGEGAFIYSPRAWVLKLDGEVLLSALVSMGYGFSITASPWPFAGPLDGVLPQGLCIHQFNPATGGYRQNCYNDRAWEGDGGGSAAPQLSVGESFFIYNPSDLLMWDFPGRLHFELVCP